ncbi:hypothetical protein [Microlunatus sp. Y2014]|uniref:hypothetical protein n=1 Tax=Microlunatus sp. Y2014 TaxID=3418488 RepID=UPI003DA78965
MPPPPTPPPARRVLATVVLAVAAAVLGSCALTPVVPLGTPTATPTAPRSAMPSQSESPPGTPTHPPSPTPGPTSQAATTPATNLSDLDAELANLERQSGARLGIAVTALGGGPAHQLGTLSTGVAWSTAKVPLALAAMADRPGEPTTSLVRRAIRSSDNEAAEALWQGWSDPTRAAGRVTEVLRDGGDRRTVVPDVRRRAPWSIYGQTEWRLADQATFTARLPCLAGGEQLVAEMAQVDDGQRWGFAASALPDSVTAAVKGGWGPGPDGGYLVRQLAIVTWGDGTRVAVALAAEPASGTYADGTVALDRLAAWALAYVEVAPADGC